MGKKGQKGQKAKSAALKTLDDDIMALLGNFEEEDEKKTEENQESSNKFENAETVVDQEYAEDFEEYTPENEVDPRIPLSIIYEETDEDLIEEDQRMEEMTYNEQEYPNDAEDDMEENLFESDMLDGEMIEEDCWYANNSEFQEKSEKSDCQDATIIALQEALNEEKSLQLQHKNALLKAQADRDALAEALQREQAEKDSLRVKMELMEAQMTDLKKSQKVTEQLKNELEASSSRHQRDAAEREKMNSAKIKELKRKLNDQQDESLKKDDEIQRLRFDIQNFRNSIADKDSTVSSLQEKVNQLALDLEEERKRSCKFQRDCDAAISQHQEEAEKLNRLTCEHQQLACENKKLQGELEAALNKRQLDLQLLQEDEEPRSRSEEASEKERTWKLKAREEIQKLKKELSEKTQALEKSLAGERHLRSALSREKKRFEQMVLEKQSADDPLTFLNNQLKQASSKTEGLIYDMKTLCAENADIMAKFKATKANYNALKSKHSFLSGHFEEMMLTKNKTISENQCTIAKLQSMVDELKGRQSESSTRDTKVEDALKHEMAKNAELQQKVDQISSALEKERTTCQKYNVQLMEAMSKQMEIQEEKHKLAMALQRAKYRYKHLQEKHQMELNFKMKHMSDTERRLNQQTSALNEHTDTDKPQREHNDLVKKHNDCQNLES